MQCRTLLLLPALLLALGLGACGGGGSEPDGCEAPGVLRALAIAGTAAAGTAGDFELFPTDVPMDVAAGGWTVFVAPTTDPAKSRCLYVALPDSSLRIVWAAGDAVPDADGGVVADVLAVWVSASGRILAYVTITGDGGGRTFGLLSARVAGGVVVDRHDVIYETRSMVTTGLTGTLTSIATRLTLLVEDGRVFFVGGTSSGDEGLFCVAADGTSLTLLAGTGTALPAGHTVDTIEAMGVEAAGTLYAFIAGRSDPWATRGLYVGQVGSAVFSTLIEDGDPMSDGVVADLPSSQPLAVDVLGRVLFKAVSTFFEDHLCVAMAGAAPSFIVVEGEEDTWTEGVFGDLNWLHNQRGVTVPMLKAGVGPNPHGITFALYGVFDLLQPPSLAMFNGRDVPGDLGGTEKFSSTFPGLTGEGRRDVAADGALAFANVLNSGRPGLFWLIAQCGLFTVAAGGQATLGGDQFDGTSAWRATTATGVIVFRAPLVTAGSGIFRRGP